MNFIKRPFFLFILFFAGCGENYPPVENPVDAGRQFIDAIYKGNFKRAEQLIINTEANTRYLSQKIETDFRKRNSQQKEMLSKSSIQILKVKMPDDNTTIVGFINAYTQKTAQLKVLQKDGRWLIDLAFTFVTQ